MQSRGSALEEGKNPTVKANHSRVMPHRLFKLLVLFLVLCFIFSAVTISLIRHFGGQSIFVTNMSRTSFLSCIEEPLSLDRWIKPPSNLLHNMNDSELLWRASFAPQRKQHPFTRVPKIAFMFLTKGPLPLAPIWERFFKGHDGLYSIYVHSLPSFKPAFPSSSIFYKRQIPSQVSEWGRMSMCDAERRLLANALLDISNEWFILLSESCIPLYNFTVAYQYLMKSKYSFIGAFDDPGPHGRGRYKENMLPEVNISEWRKGSQWFEVNRKLAINIVEDNKFYPKFLEFCRPPCYVDEHYFPTMLTIRAPTMLANRSITWVDWSRGGPHPATFGRGDITEEFMKRVLERQNCTYNDQPSSVCYLFGRKFAPSTMEPLLLLAPKFLGF